jgi:hypothetical protein
VCIHGWILPGGHARYIGLVVLEFKVDKFVISEFYVVMVCSNGQQKMNKGISVGSS